MSDANKRKNGVVKLLRNLTTAVEKYGVVLSDVTFNTSLGESSMNRLDVKDIESIKECSRFIEDLYMEEFVIESPEDLEKINMLGIPVIIFPNGYTSKIEDIHIDDADSTITVYSADHYVNYDIFKGSTIRQQKRTQTF